jgi:hypothetical protein
VDIYGRDSPASPLAVVPIKDPFCIVLTFFFPILVYIIMLKFGNKNKNNQRRVSIQDPSEGTPLIISGGTEEEEGGGVTRGTAEAATAAATTGNEYDDDDDSNNSEDPNYLPLGEVMFEGLKDNERRESIAADKLSMRLLEIDDDDSETEEMILRESLLSLDQDLPTLSPSRRPSSPRLSSTRMSLRSGRPMSIEEVEEATRKAAVERLCTIIGISVVALLAIGVALYIGVEFIGPPNMPVGPYELVERQVMPFVFLLFIYLFGWWGGIFVPTDTLLTKTPFRCMLFLLRLISSLLFCRREPNFFDFIPFTKDRIQLDRMDISIMCHRHRP